VLKQNDVFSFEQVENSFILHISSVSLSHKGKYVLEAANKLGNLVVDFELDVLSNNHSFLKIVNKKKCKIYLFKLF
jgi:phosphopantetheinyl transferase